MLIVHISHYSMSLFNDGVTFLKTTQKNLEQTVSCLHKLISK